MTFSQHLLAGLIVVLSGCGGCAEPDFVVNLADYDRSCSADSDCKLIYEGDHCACWGCYNGAISNVDYDAYAALAKDAEDSCNHTQCGALEPATLRHAASCAEVEAVCEGGQCAIRETE